MLRVAAAPAITPTPEQAATMPPPVRPPATTVLIPIPITAAPTAPMRAKPAIQATPMQTHLAIDQAVLVEL